MARPAPALSEAAAPRNMAAQERKWRAEEALRTLVRADEILADDKLLNDVLELAKKQADSLGSIVGDMEFMCHHYSVAKKAKKGNKDADQR